MPEPRSCLRIGLDFDGVITDYALLKSRVAKDLFSVEVSPALMSSRHINEHHPLTLEQYKEAQYEALFGKYVEIMEPIEGAVPGIRSLLEVGHRVEIITSRTGEGLEAARLWLERQGMILPLTGVGFGVSKRTAVTGCDAYLDDGPDVLEPLEGLPTRLFLYSPEPVEDVQPGIVRVPTWNAFCQEIALLVPSR